MSMKKRKTNIHPFLSMHMCKYIYICLCISIYLSTHRCISGRGAFGRVVRVGSGLGLRRHLST